MLFLVWGNSVWAVGVRMKFEDQCIHLQSHISCLQSQAFPFIYYLLAIWGALRFFARPQAKLNGFTPPVSILKPVRGLDPDAYENFASFCRQDYPEYEIVFCVGALDDPCMPAIEQPASAIFRKQHIRVLFGSGRVAANDKVAKLVRLANEAQYEYLVINDSDVRVKPDYLRRIVAPMEEPKVGAVTCFYVSIGRAQLY